MRGPEGDRAEGERAVGELVDALTLLAVLDEAVTASLAAETLLTSCADGTRLRPVDARAGLHLRCTFARLQRWIDDLDLPAREEDIRDEASRLLAFYLHLLTHALDAPFSIAGRDRIALRSRGPLTGAPSARLTALRDRLRAIM